MTIAAEPYQAIVELLERPLAYDALVLSLPTLYREELNIIRTIRERLGHLDVFVADTDGRHAALAEAMRLGATGLLGDEGLHRLASVGEVPATRDAGEAIRASDAYRGGRRRPARSTIRARRRRPPQPTSGVGVCLHGRRRRSR